MLHGIASTAERVWSLPASHHVHPVTSLVGHPCSITAPYCAGGGGVCRACLASCAALTQLMCCVPPQGSKLAVDEVAMDTVTCLWSAHWYYRMMCCSVFAGETHIVSSIVCSSDLLNCAQQTLYHSCSPALPLKSTLWEELSASPACTCTWLGVTSDLTVCG